MAQADSPYDVPAMTTQPSKPETPPVGPMVCACGYDLTGLPVDAGAKCPECGAEVGSGTHGGAWHGRTWVRLLIAAAPAIVFIVYFFGIGSVASRPLMESTVNPVMIVSAALLLFVSLPMSVVIGLAFWPTEGAAKGIAVALGAVALCLIVHFLVFVGMGLWFTR